MVPRIHLFELLDYRWFPESLRRLLTDFLSFLWSLKLPQMGFETSPVEDISDCVEEALLHSGAEQIVDLCSGSGGPPVMLYQVLNEKVGNRHTLPVGDRAVESRGLRKCPPVVLTDLYPNASAFRRLAQQNPDVTFREDPTDALTCRFSRPTFRTIFNGFHHFRPEQARQIIVSAVNSRDGIGVFELTSRKLPSIVMTMFGLPILTFLLTPFVRPVRLARFFYVYLIPIIPLCQLFNGTVSCLRTYTREELLEMAYEADPEQAYEWRYRSHFVGLARVTSFVGYPRKRS